MEQWVVCAKRAPFQEIAAKFHIDQVTARLLRNRDICTDEEIQRYLHPSLDDLHDPSLLTGASEAAELIQKKISEGKKIRIIGDYDIDGVNASYILLNALRRCGADVDCEIPDRMRDGFGLNIQLVEMAFEEGIDTIVTCDNGISACDQVRYARKLGMTVIITDHHEPLFEDSPGGRNWLIPPANVVVDPKLPGDTYPYAGICGAVVAWKVIRLLYDLCGVSREEWMKFLPYAAFATIGDVMDLRDENRPIVRFGLQALETIRDIGMRALIQSCNLEERKLSAYHVGFILGPCINAGGRLDTAKRSLKLLLTKDPEEAKVLASELTGLNERRKELTEEGIRSACEQIEHASWKTDPVYVVFLENCHESIAGIVAGKIRERYYHPVFVLTNSMTPGMLKGSGRSVENWNMFEGLVRCTDLLDHFGGHAMAAGLSLPKANLELFREKLRETCQITTDELTEKVKIDAAMPVSYLREDLLEEFEVLEPCGKGNEKPLFAEKGLKLLKMSVIGKNRTGIRFLVESSEGTRIPALYFGDVQKLEDYLAEKYSADALRKLMFGTFTGMTLTCAYYPSINEYRGVRSLQIVITKYR